VSQDAAQSDLPPGCPRCGYGSPAGVAPNFRLFDSTISPPFGWTSRIQYARPPALCPVCEGRGTVPHDFYAIVLSPESEEQQCRTCGGRGVV
jgi:hypothetical protein